MTNAELVSAITVATHEVFSMMLGMDVKAGEPFVDASAGQFSRRFYRSIYNP